MAVGKHTTCNGSGCSHNHGNNKENNGRAARIRLQRRLLMIFGSCLAVITLITLRRLSSHGNLRPRTVAQRRERQRQDDAGGFASDMGQHINGGGGGNIRKWKKGRGGGTRKTTDKTTSKEELVLTAQVQLVDLTISPRALSPSHHGGDTYAPSITAEFCFIDWSLHKTDPSLKPMFRDLLNDSQDCQRNKFSLPLKSIVTKAREYDDRHDTNTVSLPPSGFVFHESRCGSTLVANSLVYANPEAHRVFSESPPPPKVLRACDGKSSDSCSLDLAAELFADVVYMMGRTSNPNEKRQYYKIQSAGTFGIHVFRKALPDVPWMFVYRDPVQVMMSHMAIKRKEQANCVRPVRMQSSNPMYMELMGSVNDNNKGKKKDVGDLNLEEKCALHLASICEHAKREQEQSQTGIMVNYIQLPTILINSIFPNHFDIPMTSDAIQRVTDGSKNYSKNRVNPKGGGQRYANGFVPDSEKKEKKASPEVKAAAELFLGTSFEYLESESRRYVETSEM